MGGLWRSGHKPWLFIGFDSLFSTRACGLWGVMRTSWVCLVPLSPQPCLLEYGWECGTQGGGSWWSLGCQQGWLLRLWKHKADYCVVVQIRNLVPWVNQFALLPWRPLSWFRPIPPTFYRNSLGDSKVIFTNERWCTWVASMDDLVVIQPPKMICPRIVEGREGNEHCEAPLAWVSLSGLTQSSLRTMEG